MSLLSLGWTLGWTLGLAWEGLFDPYLTPDLGYFTP